MNFIIKVMVILSILLFSLSYIFFMPNNSFEKEEKYYEDYRDIFNDFVKENIIRLELIFDKKIDCSKIKVKVKDSVITLTGTVQDRDSLNYITKKIKNLSLLEGIISEIRIGDQGIEIPIEYEDETQANNRELLYKKFRAFKSMLFDGFHYKNKLLFDFYY